MKISDEELDLIQAEYTGSRYVTLVITALRDAQSLIEAFEPVVTYIDSGIAAGDIVCTYCDMDVKAKPNDYDWRPPLELHDPECPYLRRKQMGYGEEN